MNIFEIGFYALRGTFYSIPELNINISFKNVIKLENDRNNVMKDVDADAGHTYNFLEVPGKVKYKNKSYSADLRLKGDRKIHFEEKKYGENVGGSDIKKKNSVRKLAMSMLEKHQSSKMSIKNQYIAMSILI